MLTDGLTARQDSKDAAGLVQLVDVAQLLLGSINTGPAKGGNRG